MVKGSDVEHMIVKLQKAQNAGNVHAVNTAIFWLRRGIMDGVLDRCLAQCEEAIRSHDFRKLHKQMVVWPYFDKHLEQGDD